MQLRGMGIGSGIAQGTVLRMPDPIPTPAQTPSTLSADQEKARSSAALKTIAELIRRRAEHAGGSAKDVLDAQAMMAEDPALLADIDARIDSGATAERAVFEAFDRFREMLAGLGGYQAERAADLDDIWRRVVAELQGGAAPGVPESEHPFVLVARDLAPADTAVLDLDAVLAVVTAEGGPTSHTAIMAREKSIVAVVGVAGADQIADGETVIVDAGRGLITLAPTEQERAAAEVAARAVAAAAAESGPGRLADGTPVPLLVNLGSADQADEAVRLGAEGVGLFRTEFLFLDAEEPPSIAVQREQYARLLTAFDGHKVVVRVLDAGADKPLAFLNDADEPNPALGLRGLRALRQHEPVLRDQLTALAAAAAQARDGGAKVDLWVMAPMVATVEETAYFVGLAKELGVLTAGVMIEVPSAALLAEQILGPADFASLGTNDLTQYTLAADRVLGSVAAFQDPWHPAVLRLIGEVGAAGVALQKSVGVCGEAAADPLLAVVLVGLGVTSLSMSPSALAGVRAELRRHGLADAQALAAIALAADGAPAARAAVAAAVDAAGPPSA